MNLDSLTRLREEIAAYLEADGRFTGCKIMTAYPGRKRDYPVRKPVLAIGLDAVEAKGSLGGFLTAGAEADLYGAAVAVTLRFDLFTPAEGESNPYILLDALWERLLIEEGPFGFLSFSNAGMAWDSVTEANRLTAKGTLQLLLSRRDETAFLEELRVVRKEDDTSI